VPRHGLRGGSLRGEFKLRDLLPSIALKQIFLTANLTVNWVTRPQEISLFNGLRPQETIEWE
jgi:hypothetical protein